MNPSTPNPNEPTRDQLRELAMLEACFGAESDLLTPEERSMLEAAAARGDLDLLRSELAVAAAATGTLSEDSEALPSSLTAKLRRDASAWRGSQTQGRHPADPLPAMPGQASPNPSPPPVAPVHSWRWPLAAAAGILVALAAGYFFGRDANRPSTLSPRAQLAAMLAQPAQDQVQWPLIAGSPDAPRGEFVWSDSEQTGYLRLRGLPVNDANRSQYQLWIFDGERKHPVDGGVFDVDAKSGDVVVPVRAALSVHEATAVAITVEKPGGVVVSEREQIVATGNL